MRLLRVVKMVLSPNSDIGDVSQCIAMLSLIRLEIRQIEIRSEVSGLLALTKGPLAESLEILKVEIMIDRDTLIGLICNLPKLRRLESPMDVDDELKSLRPGVWFKRCDNPFKI